MGRETVARARSALTVLVVTADAAGGAAAAAVQAAADELLVTRALTLPSALATLASDTFDCVLVDTAVPDLAAVEMTRAIRARSGTAMLVVAHADRYPGAGRLDEVADLVLGPDDLRGDWLRLVRMHARLTEAEASTARLAGIVDGKAQLSASIRNLCNLADLKMTHLLDTIDDWVLELGISSEVGDPERFEATRVPEKPDLSLDLTRFSTVVWATGFRPDHSWLHARVLDRKGRLRHDGGVITGAPGLYRIGLNMLRRRKSSFIHGAEDDARDITDHLAAYLGVGASV